LGLGSEQRVCGPSDVVVIPGGTAKAKYSRLAAVTPWRDVWLWLAAFSEKGFAPPDTCLAGHNKTPPWGTGAYAIRRPFFKKLQLRRFRTSASLLSFRRSIA
jgi:hypothetical protein